MLNLLNRFCSEYLVFIAGQVHRIEVVEDVLKVMMNWLGCAERRASLDQIIAGGKIETPR